MAWNGSRSFLWVPRVLRDAGRGLSGNLAWGEDPSSMGSPVHSSLESGLGER